MSEKRSIFEEVGQVAERQSVQPGVIDRARTGARGAIRIWLMVLFAMVVAMILVGGLTRLTDSGLSITEWKPVTGALPPTNESAWAEEFAKYQATPEYQLQNRDMSLSEFKFIYWWEWGHRQLGRSIGLVWALGFIFFWATRSIPTGWARRLLLIGLLGGLQGAIGWWMVASGLTGQRVDVASYRLATHLGLAFIILGVIGWDVFQLGRSEAELLQSRRGRDAKLFSLSTGVMHLAFLQILLGAMVAGIDAGRNFIDWPWMAGGFLPPDLFALSPWWRNFFEDAGLVQFMHRMAGYLLFLVGLLVWNKARGSGNLRTRRAFDWMMVMLLGQVVLGIVTVMHASPLQIAIFHQFGAILLWVLILRARFQSQYPPAQSVRG